MQPSKRSYKSQRNKQHRRKNHEGKRFFRIKFRCVKPRSHGRQTQDQQNIRCV